MALTVQPVRSLLELEEVLQRYNFSLEGDGWIKSPKQLFGQIKDGESVLALTKRGELIQFTWRSQAQVYRTTPNGTRQRLVEYKRIVNGITMKPKKIVSVSEKIWAFRGETALEAIIRCFLEELGIEGVVEGDLTFIRQHLSVLSRSSSFPLRSKSCISLYKFDIPFERSKDFYIEKRERKVTEWRWKDVT